MKNAMKKPFGMLLVLALACPWNARGSDPRKVETQVAIPCPLLLRSNDWSSDPETIATSLRRFSTVPLIRSLQALAIARDYELGRRRWSAFDPRWMFGDEKAMGLLIDSHSEGYQMRPVRPVRDRSLSLRPRRARVLPQYQGIEAFVDRWEADVVKAGGSVSAAWRGLSHSAADSKPITGRRRFIKRLILELAFAYQSKNDVIPGEQPIHFTQSELDLNWSFLPTYAEVVKFFDDEQNFQTQYRDFARARLGVRTPYLRWAGLPAMLATNRVLRAQGQEPLSAPGAIRAEDQDQRERRELVENAARLILASGEKLYPLAVLANAESGIGDSVHAGALMPDLENIADHFDQLGDFVDELNRVLAAQEVVLERGPGIHHWSYEWLIQIGAAQARELRYTAQTFPGFQTADPDEPDFLNAGNYLYLNAQKYAPRKGLLFVVDLNDQIRRRLPTDG